MSLEKHHGGWVIILSFIVGFMLAIIPLPAWASVWRPDWVAMVLIYWCLALPKRVGVPTGWLIGIIHDVLSDTLLGQHALYFCLIAYISVKCSQLINQWIYNLLGYYIQVEWSFIYPAMSTMLLWPWLFILLRDLRRSHHVH